MAKRMSAILVITIALCFLYNTAASASDDGGRRQCAPNSFDLSMSWFTEDETFQRSVTAETVKVTVYGTVDPEVTIHHYSLAELIEKREYLFPNHRTRADQGLYFAATLIDFSEHHGQAEARYGREGTGYHMIFKFEWNGCWRLIAIEDSSQV